MNYSTDKNYEKQLEQLKYYKLHSEFIPFVGKKYDESRILLVEESHFCNGKEIPSDIQKDIIAKWYDHKTDELFKGYEERKDEFNTRRVASVFLGDAPGKTRKNVSYSNPTSVIRDILKTDDNKAAFNTIAFMNFFIRPEFKSGGSIKTDVTDIEKANENFVEVLNVLKPKLILILSKKVFNNIGEETKQKYKNQNKIHSFCHPSSAWWNRKRKNSDKKYSEEFKKCLENSKLLDNDNIKF